MSKIPRTVDDYSRQEHIPHVCNQERFFQGKMTQKRADELSKLSDQFQNLKTGMRYTCIKNLSRNN